MNDGRKAFVKTDGRSSDQAASSADQSGKKLAHESERISSLYHVKHARNCVRRTSWSIINFNAERKEKMRNEASWKILHFKHKNLRLINECCTGDSLPIHGLRYIEVQQGYSPTIESEMIVIPMTLPMIFLSCQRSNFSTPRVEQVGKLSLKLQGRYAVVDPDLEQRGSPVFCHLLYRLWHKIRQWYTLPKFGICAQWKNISFYRE